MYFYQCKKCVAKENKILDERKKKEDEKKGNERVIDFLKENGASDFVSYKKHDMPKVQYIIDFINNPKNLIHNIPSMAFFGGNGVGKTTLAFNIATVFVRNGYWALRTTTKYIFQRKDDYSYIQRLEKVKFLIIDEIGIADSETEHRLLNTVGILREVLDKRHNKRLQTILISNKNIEKDESFKQIIDDSRMKNFKKIFFGMNDKRGKQNEPQEAKNGRQNES